MRIPGLDVLKAADPGGRNWNRRGVPWEKLGPHLLALWLRATAEERPEMREGVDLLRRFFSRPNRSERDWLAIKGLIETLLNEPEKERQRGPVRGQLG